MVHSFRTTGWLATVCGMNCGERSKPLNPSKDVKNRKNGASYIVEGRMNYPPYAVSVSSRVPGFHDGGVSQSPHHYVQSRSRRVPVSIVLSKVFGSQDTR